MPVSRRLGRRRSDPTFTGLSCSDCGDAALLVTDGVDGHLRRRGGPAVPATRRTGRVRCEPAVAQADYHRLPGPRCRGRRQRAGRFKNAAITDTRFAAVRSLEGGSPGLTSPASAQRRRRRARRRAGPLLPARLRDLRGPDGRGRVEKGGEASLVGTTVRECGGDGVRFGPGCARRAYAAARSTATRPMASASTAISRS